jgi:hypothetical protein
VGEGEALAGDRVLDGPAGLDAGRAEHVVQLAPVAAVRL